MITGSDKSAFLVWYTTQSALQCIFIPGHWIQYQSCTHSAPSHTPWGAIWPGATSRVHAHMSHQATINVRILPGKPSYTPGWRAAMWLVSCRTTKVYRHWRESNLQPLELNWIEVYFIHVLFIKTLYKKHCITSKGAFTWTYIIHSRKEHTRHWKEKHNYVNGETNEKGKGPYWYCHPIIFIIIITE